MYELENDDEIEIDLRELFLALKKKIVWILLTAIVFAGASGLITKFAMTPIYSSTCLLYTSIVDESDIVTISGSIPAGIQKDIYATLVKMIKNKGKKVILDTSGDYLKEGIKAGPTMVKPNDEELEVLLGIKIENRYQTIDAAKEMREKYGIEYVAVSYTHLDVYKRQV